MEEKSDEKIEVRDNYKRCAYCGSPLNYSFYFCTVCATPYRPISDVIPPVSPMPLSEGELIKKKVPNVWLVFWTYAVVIFVVALINFLLFEGEELKANFLIFGSVCILLTTIVFEVIFWRSLAVQLKRTGLLIKETWIGFLFLGLMIILNFWYSSFINLLSGHRDIYESFPFKTGLGSAGIFLLFCLLPGITEEIAFRGLIQHWLQTVLRPWRAIILASALFTALHVTILGAPYIFLLSILLGWVKWKSNSLYPSILMHIAHNWICITIFPLLMQ